MRTTIRHPDETPAPIPPRAMLMLNYQTNARNGALVRFNPAASTDRPHRAPRWHFCPAESPPPQRAEHTGPPLTSRFLRTPRPAGQLTQNSLPSGSRSTMALPRTSSASQARLAPACTRSEEHTSELQSRRDLVCRLLLEKKKKNTNNVTTRTRRDKTHDTRS